MCACYAYGRLTARSKRESKDRQGIQHNPCKIQFFRTFARREHCLGGVEFAGGYDSDGAECPGGIPSGRYGGGIIIAAEYTPAAGACRSPGASRLSPRILPRLRRDL